MAYAAGTATSFSDLQTQLIAALVANGWSNPAGNIVTVSDVFFELVVESAALAIKGGTGHTTGVLTGGANTFGRIGGATSYNWVQVAFPCSFRVYINTAPHEVFVLVNYSTHYYQWMTFGKSSITLPGTGCFFSASYNQVPGAAAQYVYCTANADGIRGSSQLTPSPFRATSYFTGHSGEHVQHGIGGAAVWSITDTFAARYIRPLEVCIPNEFNSEPVLLPIRAYSTSYGSTTVAPVLDMQHLRYFKFGSNDIGDTITLGTDQWDVWPCWRLDLAFPDGMPGNSATSSGALGLAVRRT